MGDLRLKLTLRLCDNDGRRCFGPGIAALLERVEAHHSLRAAAASMGMAYSKAWRILRTAEEAFGCKLLCSTTGGVHGGGASLTPEAARLLEAYRRYAAEVEAFARDRLPPCFSGGAETEEN